MSLPDGLYELLITERLAQNPGLDSVEIQLLKDDAAEFFVDTLARQLSAVLADLPGAGDQRIKDQLELVNALLVELRARLSSKLNAHMAAEVIDLVADPAKLLRAVNKNHRNYLSPEVGLTAPWLFTAGKGSPSLLQEIRRELLTSDRVDILVSFITLSGVRKLRDVFQQLTAVSASGTALAKIRILTTTYTGATEARALDELAKLPGCEVRVSLDGRRTRLHAKAWIFYRQTGFGTAYVGSANLSGAALTGGLEWTVKLTQRSQEALYARAAAHFETLWEDNEFQHYDPDNEKHRAALAVALRRESGVSEANNSAIAFFDLEPKTYQLDMLEKLAIERSHGRLRNLVVAATGTGKTMVAAFDYRRICQIQGGKPRLLFVAHREEILQQSLRTYRAVLRDPEFGELLSGGRNPTHYDHLFATIDSVTARNLVSSLGADYWYCVVVDECHRLAADRFDSFVNAIRPQILLGLTATPERSDGRPIFDYFNARPDGSPAVEMRLWHALDLQLLAPFEYYACDDATDFSSVPWSQPGERQVLDKLVSTNDLRARLIRDEWVRLAGNPLKSKALVFCVSVAHAQFMTDFFNKSGLPAVCVVGTTSDDERRRAPQRLISGEICAIVTVDLYNEGVDLPMVDTLLLLRPTQSPVLFQQQIGRGLRLSANKESCLVLDFVGQHRAEFRFDRLFSSLTGLSRGELMSEVEGGFGRLPPGCHIHLQKQTREQVLKSLREMTMQNWRRLKTELQAYAALRGRDSVQLANFVREQAIELDDIYRDASVSGWTQLIRDAGLLSEPAGPEEAYFSRRFSQLLHMDDPLRLDFIAALPSILAKKQGISSSQEMIAQMFAYQIDGRHDQVGHYSIFMERLLRHPPICRELQELSGCLQTRSSLLHVPIPGLLDTPLCLHASYGIREILTAVGWLTAEKRVPHQAGLLVLTQRKTELLFVTLDKSDGFHDRISYHDYAISSERFHWQTQNSCGPDTKAGRRYLESAENGWQFQLFVRANKGDAYRACGPVRLESAEGDRPMNIVWRLDVPLPMRLFREFSVLRGV